MKYIKKTKIILALIIGLGLFLRVYQLNISPPGFNADEAALGYNAYSLLKTGKDEWNEAFPLAFKSFSDYKPGLYVYLAMPFVAVFGLNEFAVRLPSILLGVLTIYLIYLLAKEITDRESIGISSAFLLSISPWHIHYSRGAWETNIATFFITLGFLAFVKGFKKQRLWIVSGVSFVLSMYAYQSPRVLVPLFGIFLFAFYAKKILTKKTLIPAVITTLMLIPLLFLIFGNKGLARFQGVSIFTDIGPTAIINEQRGEHKDGSGAGIKLFHNKIVAYGINFFDHYLDHFTPNFLFANGDPLGRNKIPEMGQLYLFEIITLVLGIFYLIRYQARNVKIIFIWLFIAPIAASLTYQTPHALRAENMVVPLTLISGSGLGYLIDKIRLLNKPFYILGKILTSLVIIFFFAKFMHQYFIHLPQQYALEWEYGFSELVPMVNKYQDNYEKVVITTRYDQPYILFLFFNKYDPSKFQDNFTSSSIDKFGFSTVSKFDKYEFRAITKEEIDKSKNTLFVGTEEEIPEGRKVIDQLNFPNGKTMVKIIGT